VTQSTSPNSQSEWRLRAIESAGYDPRRDFTDEPFSRWWYNGINRNSLRLTRVGHEWLSKNAKFIFYPIDLNSRITGIQLLRLERFFTMPYYIAKVNRILIMDEASVVMLQLHGGDLSTYLRNLDENKDLN
jgi:hypothetical protein